MSREEDLTQLTNNELREILEEYEEPTDGNKAELVDRIVRFETGLPTPQETEEEADVDDAEGAANEADETDTPPEGEPEETRTAVEPAEGEGDDVLVKYLGSSGHYEAGGKTFSLKHPFAVVSSDTAEWLVRKYPTRFRNATGGEVENYYS